MTKPAPLYACVKCGHGATFQDDRICRACRDRAKDEKATNAPEVKR